jgi:hypothetical protein
MTDETLEPARRNASEAGGENVEFIRVYIEVIPLLEASVNVVIANCVITCRPTPGRSARGGAGACGRAGASRCRT